MALSQASPTWLLIVLSAATLPTALSVVMLGPLLVALAHELVIQLKVRESAELLAPRDLHQDHTTTGLKARMAGALLLPNLRW